MAGPAPGLLLVAQAVLDRLVRAFVPDPDHAAVATRQVVDRVTVLVTYSILVVAVWLAGRYLDRRSVVDFGFHLDRAWWTDFGFGLALGAVLMSLVFVVEVAMGWASVSGHFATRTGGLPFWPGILVPLMVYVAVGLGEELWSRGYVLTNLAEGLNSTRVGPGRAIMLATVVQGIVFALLHANNPNASVVSTVNTLLLSFMLASGFVLTGELAIPIGLHIAWNFLEGNVFGFPVSGSGSSIGTFIRTSHSGPALWTGGAFGPEGGLLGIGAVLVGSLVIVVWVRARRGGLHIAREIAEPAAWHGRR